MPSPGWLMKLRQVISHPGDGIEAAKIQFAEAIIEEELLHNAEFPVERIGDTGLIEQGHTRREEHIVFLAAVNKSDVCGIKERRVNGNREWFILRDLFQD